MMKRTSGERRASGRFPISQEVRYRLLEGRRVCQEGEGRTLDMSSGGVLFTTEDPVGIGKRVELSVDWPARLDGNCRLKLVALGRVVRSDHLQAAIAIERYEFKTQGARAFQAGALAAQL